MLNLNENQPSDGKAHLQQEVTKRHRQQNVTERNLGQNIMESGLKGVKAKPLAPTRAEVEKVERVDTEVISTVI